MKIDIHIHTKKIKSGDSSKRQIDPKSFCEIIRSTDVRICAITNHNTFDITQYLEMKKIASHDFIIWPGIELDIEENGNSGHLLVIVNPRYVSQFSDLLVKIMDGINPNEFKIGIKDAVQYFDEFDALYIPHFLSKKKSISNEDIEYLTECVSNPKRILKEASNSISAGIFISHGHRTIYGSDIQDWDDYIKESKNLPDLRLPVDSFEQFCLLLERDDSTIKTILEKKTHQKISVNPFPEDDHQIEIEIYDDINVLFGSKGTGKTEILKALSKYYNSQGHRTSVFESNAKDLAKQYDLNGNEYHLDINKLPVDSCQSDFMTIRQSSDNSVTSMKKYYEFFSETETSKLSKKIKIKSLPLFDDKTPEIRLSEINELKSAIREFSLLIKSNEIYEEVIGEELYENFMEIFNRIDGQVVNSLDTEFVDYHSKRLFNKLVQIFTVEVSKKTGKYGKPISTGFQDYAINRLKIESAAKKIIKNIEKKIKLEAEYVGDLGEKGKLFCKTSLEIQNGFINDSTFKHLDSITKNPQRHVAKKITKISKEIYADTLFKRIEELNEIENGSSVSSIENLILFKRSFELGYKSYKPSNGESAMILLTRELESNKEIFLIDEPEKSLGNDYINDFIVPLLKTHASSCKTVIIATHDANIAVRTLPYKSIYREHDVNCYRTYMGNPFSNNLICSSTLKQLDWKEISMRTLEGGRNAFGERGRIYEKT